MLHILLTFTLASHFKSVTFIASRVYGIPNLIRGNLRLTWCLRFCRCKKHHDQRKHVRKVFIYLCTLVTVYQMKPHHEIGCRHSMNACGIILITGFMSMLSAVLFLINPRTTYLQGYCPQLVLSPYINHLLSTWLTHKTTAHNNGSHS